MWSWDSLGSGSTAFIIFSNIKSQGALLLTTRCPLRPPPVVSCRWFPNNFRGQVTGLWDLRPRSAVSCWSRDKAVSEKVQVESAWIMVWASVVRLWLRSVLLAFQGVSGKHSRGACVSSAVNGWNQSFWETSRSRWCLAPTDYCTRGG